VRVFRVPALPEVIRMGLEAKAGAAAAELQHS
jgi:aldehyde oxidoreductase